MDKEIMKKLNAAKTAEEIVSIAKEAGRELSLADAGKWLADHSGKELSDDDLDQIAGGRVILPLPWN